MSRVRRSAAPTVGNKDDAKFKEALQLYESKQYRKSVKVTETILKKNSNHAESYALKALNLHFLKETEESEEYISRAVAKNANSPVLNHILGILRRAQQNYSEAAKYFQLAIDSGSSNKQILRDLSVVQLQTRDLKNLPKSRLNYLEEFLGYRANWTALAIAYDLTGDYAAAEKTLIKFEDLARGKLTEAEMFENSELELYKNHMVARIDTERALKELEELDTFDKYEELELKGKYLLKLGRHAEASKVYRQLLKRNPDNFNYYTLLEISLKTIGKSEKFRDSLYTKLKEFYPRSDAPRFIPLTFTTGDLFKARVESYVLDQLKRGVPATFTNVKPLYSDKEKVQIIEDIVLKFYESEKLDPLVWVWITYFLAQHYLVLHNLSKAKELIESAIEHTPTLVELYILKARIFKHYGDFSKAAEIINEGRLIDLQDRFINSKTVKYYLRANSFEKAVEIVSIFTKNDDNTVNGIKDLHTMQASWFIIESAEAYLRLYKEAIQSFYKLQDHESYEKVSKYGSLALKRFKAIVKVFEEYYNDQLDFHTYCTRRGTPRAYIEMINWEDSLFKSPVYVRAVKGASEIYLGERTTFEEESSEQKSDKKSKKDKAAKFKALELEKKTLISYDDDEDVFGYELYNTDNWLSTFQKEFFHHLVETKYGTDLLITNELSFRLEFKLNKIALALNSLIKLDKLTNGEYEYILELLLDLKFNAKEGISKILSVKGLEKNFPNVDFSDFNALISHFLNLDKFEGVSGLVAVVNLKLENIDNDHYKQVILEKIKDFEPVEQLSILSKLTT